MYHVYILYSQSIDRFYVGYTNILERRIREHNRKKGKYTDAGLPWELAHIESFEKKKDAMDREKFIKSKKLRKYIEILIAGEG